MFTIVMIDTQGVETLLPEHKFEVGSTAAHWAAALTKDTGIRHVPRKVADADWRTREGLRAPMPAGWDIASIPDHFLHVSIINSEMVVFTPSVEHGENNRQTRMRPGAYLNRFYPQLHQNDVKRLVAIVQPLDALHYAWTADEIEDVYTHGPRSCMGGPLEGSYSEEDDEDEEYNRDPFCSDVHPVRAYAAGDLAVAYTRNRHGSISGRVLVWPEKKIYGTVYGDEDRIRNALQEQGYAYGQFTDARILKIPQEDGEDEYVLPYIDGPCGLFDRGDFFVIAPPKTDNPDIWANNTEGVSGLLIRCERDPDVRCSRYDMSEVTMSDGSIQQWSWNSKNSHALVCRRNHRYYERSAMVETAMHGWVAIANITPNERQHAQAA